MENIIKDSKRVLKDKNIKEEYYKSHYMDNLKKPEYVVLPVNEQEVLDVVNYANINNKKIIPRGANTGAVGSQMSVNGKEIMVDLSLMKGIIHFDENNLVVTVLPGTLLKEVQDFADNKGYLYAPDPASKHSTIGGNVSTNAGGLRAIKYGTTRDHVKALRVVLATGEVVSLGGLTVKNSAGYDLLDLFIGSEGTLGIITEIKLKLVPKPNISKTAILAFDNINDGTDAVLRIIKNKFDIFALELFDKEAISYSEKFMNKSFPTQKGNSYILLGIDSEDKEHLNSELKRLKETLKNDVAHFVVLNKEEEKLSWDLRDNILYALMEFTHYEMLDEVVPIDKFAEMINYTKILEEKHQVKILNFGHAGDGNIHTILLKEDYKDKDWLMKREELLKSIYDKVTELGGLISAEHGIGYLKKDYFLTYTDQVKVELMKKIKGAIDPKNIFNPNKIF